MRKLIKQFFELESASGVILLFAAVAALIWANSPWESTYNHMVDVSLFWINEGAMALFFLVVGLELQRGYLEGRLSSYSHIALPAVGALGGMLVPAFIYLLVNYQYPDLYKGWATPVATDIAFAVGVLTLFSRRIPDSLKLFLLMLAIFDDIGAIIIIALFYSHGISLLPMLGVICLVGVLYLINRSGVLAIWPYLFVGILLWVALLQAGVHPTLSGVLVALMLPGKKNSAAAPVYRLEDILHPWVAFLVMPLFALINAGIPIKTLGLPILTSTIVWGVALGLFIGKQIGVFASSWLMIKLGYARLPERATWKGFYGVAILCGIGFTMSLFLGTLSFKYDNVTYLDEVRFGVIIGSLLSGLLGALVLSFVKERHRA